MPRAFSVEHDGLTIAGLDWGGAGVPLLLLHPNGFCAGLFDPLAVLLTDRFRPIGVDLRGHGGSDAPEGHDAYGFDLLAGDVVAVLDHLGLDDVVALGQSLGGGVATLVDRQCPGRLRRVLLCEAIAFPQVAPPGPHDNPMATAARRRRAVWPDRDTMVASYGSRPPLDELAPEALAAYVRWGTVDRPDGSVALACPPEIEATIFEASARPRGARLAWAHLADLTAAATIVAGDRTTLPSEWFADQARRAGCELEVVAGGHFFVQEDTARAARLVMRHLGMP